MQSTNRLAVYSVLSKMIKVLSGPLSLIFVAKYLTEAEIAIYYTFISIIMMQQLLEIGIGSVLLQHIAHATEYKNNKLTSFSNEKIAKLVNFAFSWFLLIAIFIIVVIFPIGNLFFNNVEGSQGLWEKPWLWLIIATSLSIYLTPIKIFTEAIQKQQRLFLSQLFSSIVSSIGLWVALFFGGGLYSIAISTLLSLIVLNMLIFKDFSRELEFLSVIKINVENFISILKKIWPLLKNVSLVWFFGYFFWNAFNLLAVQHLDLTLAGTLLFTVAIARTGYQVASSIMNSQIAKMSWLIGEGRNVEATKLHRKFLAITLGCCIFGYLFIALCIKYQILTVVTDKLLPWDVSSIIFIFYTLVLIMASSNQFSRCHKIEPYVKVSALSSVVVFLATYFLLGVSISLTFTLLSIYMLFAISMCLLIDRKLNLGSKEEPLVDSK